MCYPSRAAVSLHGLSLHDALPILTTSQRQASALAASGDQQAERSESSQGECAWLGDKRQASRDGIEAGWKSRVRIVKDRKSTRLNSSHVSISYAVFCLK